MFVGVGETMANKQIAFGRSNKKKYMCERDCNWEKKNFQTMAKCLAIFEGTSVKLKTLVARSAVMFVLKNVINELNLLY